MEPPKEKADSTKVAPPKVEPPKEKADSTKVAPPKVEPPKEKADSTVVADTKDESKTENAKKSTRLSWSEIGKIAWKSTKKFVKGMFCDEEGKFSIGRTAATVGIIAGLALAAPVTAALGASAAVVGAVATTVKVAGVALTGYMLYNGGKNVIEGTKDYYNAETKEDAVEAMEQAWDGGVELASIPVIGGLMKAGGKLLKFVKPKSSTPKSSTGVNEGVNQGSNTQPKPVESTSTQPKPVEPAPTEAKPVENSTSNQSSNTQSSSSSQSSVVESQPTTPKKERGFVEQMRRDAEARRIKNERKAEQARKAEEVRKAEEARKAQEAEQAKRAEKAKLSEEERLAEARLRGEGFNEIDTYTADNYVLTLTSGGERQIAGATSRSNYNFWKHHADLRSTIEKSTEIWQRVNSPTLGTYDIIKIPSSKGNCHIVYRPKENATAIIFETVGGRGGDNFTFHFEGKVPEAKCRDFIEFFNNSRLGIEYNEKPVLDFMNGKIKGANQSSNTKPKPSETQRKPTVEEKLAEARARQIEVTEESLPQLKEALRAELKEEVLVQQVLDEVSGFLAFKDYPISEYSPIRFSEFPGNKVGIEVGGKTYLITKGSKPNVTTPKTEPKVETKPKTETTTARVEIKADDVTISYSIDGVTPPQAYKSKCYLNAEPNACPDVRTWLTDGLPLNSRRPYAVKYNAERTESIIVIGLPGRPGSNVTLKIKGFVPKANVEKLAQYVQNNIAKVNDYNGMASRIESLGHKGFADVLNGSADLNGVRSVGGGTKITIEPKTEPKVQAKPKVEPTQQPVVQSSNITSFTTNNGQNIAFEGGMSKMFKITQVSSDEAIITLSEDIAMRKEALALVDGFSKYGLIDFTMSPEPKSVQLIATKPGKLKLVNGQWKLTEPIQTTNALETPIANTSSSAKAETKVPKVEVGATTSALETAKAQHLQKIAQGNVVKPEGIEQLVRSLVPHNYANDNTIIKLTTRSKEVDYSAIIPKQSQKYLFEEKNFRKLLGEHTAGDFDYKYIGELPNGQKVVEVVVPTGRVDRCGRPIKAFIQTVSQDGNYTQLQKDLLALIESGVISDKKGGTHILSVCMLEKNGDINSEIFNEGFAVDLEILYSSIATALKQVK